MSHIRVEVLLGGLAMALFAFAMQRAGKETATFIVAVPVPPAVARRASEGTPALLSNAATRLVSANPFRLNRAPGLIRVGQPMDLAAIAAAPVEAAPKVRPTLAVRAIIGGPPWTALIEGLPQTNGSTVVREGERHGELTVSSIGRDTVVVAARDTLWKLTVGRGSQ